MNYICRKCELTDHCNGCSTGGGVDGREAGGVIVGGGFRSEMESDKGEEGGWKGGWEGGLEGR